MFDHSIRVGDAIDNAAATLDESDAYASGGLGARSGAARADATLLMRHLLGVGLAEIYAERERPLTPEQIHQYSAMVRERSQGAPIQYITGTQEFFGLPFRVTPAVLIPRPETEHLVEAAIERLRDHPAPRIADVGTGSGCIAVALAQSLPLAHVVALDSSADALPVAEQNAQYNHVAERIRFAASDLLSAVASETFDAIVSNPPYIADHERKTLSIEVRRYEPAQALFAGPTGLEVYRRLIPAAFAQLTPGGWLLMEIGHGQRDALAQLLQSWAAVDFLPDLQGIPRVAIARKS